MGSNFKEQTFWVWLLTWDFYCLCLCMAGYLEIKWTLFQCSDTLMNVLQQWFLRFSSCESHSFQTLLFHCFILSICGMFIASALRNTCKSWSIGFCFVVLWKLTKALSTHFSLSCTWNINNTFNEIQNINKDLNQKFSHC